MDEDYIRGLYDRALKLMKDRYGLADEPRLLCVSDAAAFKAALRELGKEPDELAECAVAEVVKSPTGYVILVRMDKTTTADQTLYILLHELGHVLCMEREKISTDEWEPTDFAHIPVVKRS